MRVLVIGAGIIGCSVANYLAEAGCSVTAVDSGDVAGGATRASFAWLNSNSKEPRIYHDLNVAGIQEHTLFAAQSHRAPWFHPSGNFEWSTTEGEAYLEAKVRRLRDWGYSAEWVTVEELKKCEPDVSVERARKTKIAFYPDEGWVDPQGLARELLLRATRMGATIRTDREVVSMDVDRDGRIARVITHTEERFDSDLVVVCAGPATEKVLSLAGGSIPMRNKAGVIGLSKPAKIGLQSVLHAPTVAIRPGYGGRVLMLLRAPHVSSTRQLSGAHSLREGNRALAAAADFVPALRGSRIESTRVGVRPIPYDGLPVVGFLPGFQNLYVAVTHSGVTLTLLLGRLIASEIALHRPEPALAPFRPDRFAS